MRSVLRLTAAVALGAAMLPAVPASAAPADQTTFARWTSTADFAAGTSVALKAGTGSMTLGTGTAKLTYDDPRVSGGPKSYRHGAWTSPWQSTGFAARTLIPSWSIKTPGRTWAKIQVRVRSGSTTGSWDTIARHATGSSDIQRTSYPSQTDDLARLSTDTIIANEGKSFTSWQVRVQLMQSVTTTAKPTLHAVNGVAATYATRTSVTSKTSMTSTKDIAVPQSSQMTHRGQHPQWGGGGEAWCSPTSMSMVMRHHGHGPKAADYAWTRYREGYVNHAARYTFDHRYDGTGNWSFNTAYAAGYSLDAFVTRLHSLRDAEAFIKAGIPLVASVAFRKGELSGSPLSSTPGHLLVIRGFTSAGNVIVNDPAAGSNSTVRRVYNRAQLEKSWLKGSGGVVYVVRPTSRDLPADTARW